MALIVVIRRRTYWVRVWVWVWGWVWVWVKVRVRVRVSGFNSSHDEL